MYYIGDRCKYSSNKEHIYTLISIEFILTTSKYNGFIYVFNFSKENLLGKIDV